MTHREIEAQRVKERERVKTYMNRAKGREKEGPERDRNAER